MAERTLKKHPKSTARVLKETTVRPSAGAAPKAKRAPITKAQWRTAVRAVLKAREERPRPASKAWEKGGKEYEKILGYFGPPRRRPK